MGVELSDGITPASSLRKNRGEPVPRPCVENNGAAARAVNAAVQASARSRSAGVSGPRRFVQEGREATAPGGSPGRGPPPTAPQAASLPPAVGARDARAEFRPRHVTARTMVQAATGGHRVQAVPQRRVPGRPPPGRAGELGPSDPRRRPRSEAPAQKGQRWGRRPLIRWARSNRPQVGTTVSRMSGKRSSGYAQG